MIRAVTAEDIPSLEKLIEANGLFPAELLRGMMEGYLAEAGNEIWLTDDRDGLLSIAYCAPERMTEGTWNLYLIAVHPDRQGQGLGGNLLAEVERALVRKDARILLVETSGLPEFAQARAFYLKNGFESEATVRDFYKAGEDKIVFWKRLH